jgi:RNA polymerase sigma factor (sigma-70 family)
LPVSTAQQPDDADPELLSPPVTRFDVAALYRLHHGRLRRHAERALPDDLCHEADVVLMTVFTRLVNKQSLGQLTEQPNWEAYLVRAVTNACIDILKAAKNDTEIDDNDPRVHRDARTDPTGDTAAAALDRSVDAHRARDALDTLEPRLRAVVIGKVFHERTNRDLGTELDLSGQRVGQLYRQALQQLREEVNRHDG